MSTRTPPPTADDRPAPAPRQKQAHDQDQQQGQDQQKRQGQEQGRSLADWVALAISATIVLGLVGLTSYFYWTGPGTPAIIEVEPQLNEAYQGVDQYYLPVKVRNLGSETGESVRVKVTLTDAQGQQESSELSIQFLPGGAESTGFVAFSTDPRQGEVKENVVSYMKP